MLQQNWRAPPNRQSDWCRCGGGEILLQHRVPGTAIVKSKMFEIERFDLRPGPYGFLKTLRHHGEQHWPHPTREISHIPVIHRNATDS